MSEISEKLDGYWADTLGCEKSNLDFTESKIVVKSKITDYNKDRSENEVDIFVRDGVKIFSCSEDMKNDLKQFKPEIFEEDISKGLFNELGFRVENFLGPAFLSYTNNELFDRVESDCRKLSAEDKSNLKNIESVSESEEIEDSIEDCKVDGNPVFGKFIDGELVAVSSYEIWDDLIGFPTVFVKKGFRGNGYGKQVVSKSTENILEKNLVPVYRTVESWSSSVGLAKSLGYKKYASTYLIQINPEKEKMKFK